MSSSDDAFPKALRDFIFDLYDSVTTSQIADEQVKFYNDFRTLGQKYFSTSPWPSPTAIASECNGDPLFLALYRELTHRHWHAVSRPSLRDRMEGWNVYKDLFEELLETDNNYYLLPSWCFDILNEFVYQFQGYCQIRSAVYASARKQGLAADGKELDTENAPSHLVENWTALQAAPDAWDVEAVYGYLKRFVKLGVVVSPDDDSSGTVPPVHSYLSLFASVALSRLECLLADYTACLQALTPVVQYSDHTILKDDVSMTMEQVLQSVFGARLSLAYHAGVSFLMLRRYKDAMKTLGDMCAYMQRGFKTGQLRKLATASGAMDQFNKQYERMLSLLAILTYVVPSQGIVEDSVRKAVREKFGSKLEATSSFEEFFQSPKFISVDPNNNLYRQQVQLFLKEMEPQPAGRKLRSYLKLYTALPVEKLASFYDLKTEEFLPLLLSYKARMCQKERTTDEQQDTSFVDGEWKSALDIHYYLVGDVVHVDEAEKQRRFENYFLSQIAQNKEICQEVVRIDTSI